MFVALTQSSKKSSLTETSNERGVFENGSPLGFAGGDTNLTRYVGNSPTNYTDPSGLAATALQPHVDWTRWSYDQMQAWQRAFHVKWIWDDQRNDFFDRRTGMSYKYWRSQQYGVRYGKIGPPSPSPIPPSQLPPEAVPAVGVLNQNGALGGGTPVTGDANRTSVRFGPWGSALGSAWAGFAGMGRIFTYPGRLIPGTGGFWKSRDENLQSWYNASNIGGTGSQTVSKVGSARRRGVAHSGDSWPGGPTARRNLWAHLPGGSGEIRCRSVMLLRDNRFGLWAPARFRHCLIRSLSIVCRVFGKAPDGKIQR